MKKAVQFGAGNIGRGFLGQIFFQSGYQTTFIEIDRELVSLINKHHSYPLRIVGEGVRELTIRDVCAVDGHDLNAVAVEIADADIAATAVGAEAVPKVAPGLARGLEDRRRRGTDKPLNLVIAENLVGAAEILRGEVFKYLSDKGKLYAKSYLGLVEEYAILPVDKKGFRGEIPHVDGMVPYENLKAYEERKLFIHNCGHAIAAYLGYLKGYRYIYEAIGDGEIRKKVLKALQESGKALLRKHGFRPEEQREHVDNLLHRFGNVALGDTTARVGRDPIRKLSPQERLVGAANFALEYGIKPEYLSLGIAAALLYDNPEDEQAVRLSQQMKEKGVDGVLKDICNLDPDSQLGRMIKSHLCSLKRN